MKKVLIVYGSTTGNTAALAEAIASQIEAAGHKATLRNAADVSAQGLCNGYDAALFGCSAWGTDEVELQDDFQELFDQFDTMNVNGVKVACFATGDSTFTHFCGAVDVIESRLKDLGAQMISEGLKIDGELAGNESEAAAWCHDIIARL